MKQITSIITCFALLLAGPAISHAPTTQNPPQSPFFKGGELKETKYTEPVSLEDVDVRVDILKEEHVFSELSLESKNKVAMDSVFEEEADALPHMIFVTAILPDNTVLRYSKEVHCEHCVEKARLIFDELKTFEPEASSKSVVKWIAAGLTGVGTFAGGIYAYLSKAPALCKCGGSNAAECKTFWAMASASVLGAFTYALHRARR